MNPVNVSVHEFHKIVDTCLNLADEGQLSDNQLMLFKDVIVRMPLEVTNSEKERIFALQAPVDPEHLINSKIADTFKQIIELVGEPIFENEKDSALTNPSFRKRLAYYLPANEEAKLANLSKNMLAFTDKGKIEWINMNPSKSLKELGFKDIPSICSFLSRNGQHIKSLNLNEFPLFSHDFLSIINHTPHLNRLTVSSCFIDAQGFRAIPERLKQLTELKIKQCDQITDEEIILIAEGLPLLQVLDVSDCNQITDVGIQSIANRLKQLTVLEISNCHAITDAGMQSIADGLKELTRLNVNRCFRIRDAGVLAIAQGLKQLQELDLGRCKLITDTGVNAIAGGLKQLKVLNVMECWHITDAGIIAIAKELNQLKALNVSDCERITDKGIRAIIEGLKLLTSLNVSGRTQITEVGIRAIADGLEMLTTLSVSSCWPIDNELAKVISSGLKQLTLLVIEFIH